MKKDVGKMKDYEEIQYVKNMKRCTGNMWKTDGNKKNFELSLFISALGLGKIQFSPPSNTACWLLAKHLAKRGARCHFLSVLSI